MSALPIEVVARDGQVLGMSPQRFLGDYWQKRPLLIRGALAPFRAPLTPEDLAGLACEETALARIVRHDRAADRWTLRQGPFREEEFPALPTHDWTLLVQDVDKWDGDVAALLGHFDFLPHWRIDDVMVSFAAPGGSVGAHVDQYDVFLLQGPGRRRWQIDARADAPTAFRDDVDLKLLRAFSPSHDWVLEPGDMLYLPPGVPHHGVALDACLTFSIGMRAPAQAELLVDLAEFLAERVPEHQRYADPDLAPAAEAGEIDAAALRRVRQALPWFGFDAASPDAAGIDANGVGQAPRPTVPDALLRRWFGGFSTRYRSAGGVVAPPRPPTPARIAAQLDAGALLHRHPFARIAWARSDTGAELYVDGETFDCSLATARRLGDPRPLDAAAWHALDADGRVLLHDLCGRGDYALSRVPRTRRP